MTLEKHWIHFENKSFVFYRGSSQYWCILNIIKIKYSKNTPNYTVFYQYKKNVYFRYFLK